MRGSRLFVQSLLLAATASFFSQQGRLGAQAAATEQDALLGSWQLDLAKSRYVPGPPPRRFEHRGTAAWWRWRGVRPQRRLPIGGGPW